MRITKYKRIVNDGLEHCNENPIYVYLFWILRGLSPDFHIHVSVSYLYIPSIGQHTVFPAAKYRQINRGNI
jgi:hypothetical protein